MPRAPDLLHLAEPALAVPLHHPVGETEDASLLRDVGLQGQRAQVVGVAQPRRPPHQHERHVVPVTARDAVGERVRERERDRHPPAVAHHDRERHEPLHPEQHRRPEPPAGLARGHAGDRALDLRDPVAHLGALDVREAGRPRHRAHQPLRDGLVELPPHRLAELLAHRVEQAPEGEDDEDRPERPGHAAAVAERVHEHAGRDREGRREQAAGDRDRQDGGRQPAVRVRERAEQAERSHAFTLGRAAYSSYAAPHGPTPGGDRGRRHEVGVRGRDGTGRPAGARHVPDDLAGRDARACDRLLSRP